MGTAIITVTLPFNDYAGAQELEGWTGTTEEFIGIIEQRLTWAIAARTEVHDVHVTHGTVDNLIIDIEMRTPINVMKLTKKIMKAIAWVGIIPTVSSD